MSLDGERRRARLRMTISVRKVAAIAATAIARAALSPLSLLVFRTGSASSGSDVTGAGSSMVDGGWRVVVVPRRVLVVRGTLDGVRIVEGVRRVVVVRGGRVVVVRGTRVVVVRATRVVVVVPVVGNVVTVGQGGGRRRRGRGGGPAAGGDEDLAAAVGGVELAGVAERAI